MDFILYETPIKYERWAKVLLAFPIILLIAMAIFFYAAAGSRFDIPGEAKSGFIVASYILFATAPFILFVYWLVLPTKIFVLRDRIRIKYGRFTWNIGFDTVESIQAAHGIPPIFGNSSVTSYRNQVEIVRLGRMNVRLSPSERDRFLDHANRAIADWRKIQEG